MDRRQQCLGMQLKMFSKWNNEKPNIVDERILFVFCAEAQLPINH